MCEQVTSFCHQKLFLHNNKVSHYYDALDLSIYMQGIFCFWSIIIICIIFLHVGRSKEEICDFLEPLDLPDKKYIIVPINNSVSHYHMGGTHWYAYCFCMSFTCDTVLIDRAAKRNRSPPC